MTPTFLLGMAAGAASPLIALLSLTACKWVATRAAGLTSFTVLNLTRRTPAPKRAMAAATYYGAKRTWTLAVGNVGVSVLVGQDDDVRTSAYHKLRGI